MSEFGQTGLPVELVSAFHQPITRTNMELGCTPPGSNRSYAL